MADRAARGDTPSRPGEDVIAERPPVEPADPTEFKGYDALRYPADVEERRCQRCRDARYVTVRISSIVGGMPTLEQKPCPSCAGGAVADEAKALRAMHVDPTKTIAAFDFARNDQMRAAWAVLEDVIAGRRWVAFIRATMGTGKTHLSHAALIKWADTWKQHDGVFVTVPDLIDQFRACYRDGAKLRPDELLAWYRGLGFVVLDDLGAQRPKDFADEMLYALIDSRMVHKRATVLTANILPGTDGEDERIEPRIQSRISAGEVVCRGLLDQRRELEL
jgi:DNA replication protein DnaC